MVDTFVAYLNAVRHCSPATVTAYRREVERFLSSTGTEDPRTVQTATVRRYIASLVREGLGPRSVNRAMSALRSFYRFLRRYDADTPDPTVGLRGLRADSRLPVFLFEDEAADVLDSAAVPEVSADGLLASRDAALLLTADPEAGENHDLRFLKPDGLGYPGTLVAFELPVGSVGDYDDLIETIQKRARERTPKRAQRHWIRYEQPPSDAAVFTVRYASENTERAEKLAREQLEPRILTRKPIVLDFGGMDIVTQSYLHALLFSALRLAWARQSFIYVVNASSSVRSGIELVEDYALGG